jgi:hypothetical protein
MRLAKTLELFLEDLESSRRLADAVECLHRDKECTQAPRNGMTMRESRVPSTRQNIVGTNNVTAGA